jgi:hypothetical protein
LEKRKNTSQKRTGEMAQGGGPEFKSYTEKNLLSTHMYGFFCVLFHFSWAAIISWVAKSETAKL